LKKNCIVVPVYKDFVDLSNEELIALSQLYKVLGHHHIYLVGPDNFNWETYIKDAEERNIYPEFKEFATHYFESLSGYNELMISSIFLKGFKEFKYLLLYQLDAFVFRDDLEYWCNKEYDYIGAPWFEGWHLPTSTNIIGVGNGGFSLRNIQRSICILKRINTIKRFQKFWFRSQLKRIISFPTFLSFFKNYFRINTTERLDKLLGKSLINEDYYWTQVAAFTFNDFRVAPTAEAIKFSFDVNPRLLFERNNNQLPFGCHAWERYEPQFWKHFIAES